MHKHASAAASLEWNPRKFESSSRRCRRGRLFYRSLIPSTPAPSLYKVEKLDVHALTMLMMEKEGEETKDLGDQKVIITVDPTNT